MNEKTPSNNLGPFWYAIGMLFAVPLLVIILLITCVITLCAWPIIPILSYYQRKEELQNND
jgi:hypothetical protein